MLDDLANRPHATRTVRTASWWVTENMG